MTIDEKATAQNQICKLILRVTKTPHERPDLPPPPAYDLPDMDEANVPTLLRPLVSKICHMVEAPPNGIATCEALAIVALVLRVAAEEGLVRGGINNAASVLMLTREEG